MRGRFDETTLLGQIEHGHPIGGGFLARVPPSVERSYAAVPAFQALIDDAVRGRTVALSCETAQDILRRSGMHYLVTTTGNGHVLYSLEDRCSDSRARAVP